MRHSATPLGPAPPTIQQGTDSTARRGTTYYGLGPSSVRVSPIDMTINACWLCCACVQGMEILGLPVPFLSLLFILRLHVWISQPRPALQGRITQHA